MSLRWTYDDATRTLTVQLSGGRRGWRVVMADGVLVDVDSDGRALGIEVSDPLAGWDVAAVAEEFQLPDDVVADLWRVSGLVSGRLVRLPLGGR